MAAAAQHSQSSWIRFGIATTLVGFVVLSALLAGFRAGYDAGNMSGMRQRRDETYGLLRAYPVADLAIILNPDTGRYTVDFDTVVQQIMNVEPDSWDSLGGPGAIAVNASTHSVVVRQNESNHIKIRKLLESLRETGVGAEVPAENEPPAVPSGFTQDEVDKFLDRFRDGDRSQAAAGAYN